jgi:chromosome segregation ATPase
MINERMKKNIIIISIVFIVILLVAFIKPSILGYSVYQKIKKSNYSIEGYGNNIDEMKTKLSLYDTNLSLCNRFNENFLNEVKSYSEDILSCNNKVYELKNNLSLANMELDKKNHELNELRDEKEKEINDLQFQYMILAENLANNLCCKAKVDNPDVGYYEIKDNKIVCLESGELRISCRI